VEDAVGPLPAVGPVAVTPALPPISMVVPGVDSDDDYYPRQSLARVPTAVDAVLIDYPAFADDRGYYRSELMLFIDEGGRVARMRVDGDVLPPALELAARNAFMNARFRAGEADGHPVKSRIRVEVVFDSRTRDAL
jgi:uncharacterized protein (DUF934 family)